MVQGTPSRREVLVPSAALLWGLQAALLNPVIGILLVSLYDASPGDVGWVLSVYNVAGFVASLVLPVRADRTGEYLRPMLACSVLTILCAAVMGVTTSLPVALVALVAFGGPAGVGAALLFAHLKHRGAGLADIVGTRAVLAFAWVAGPPIATFVMGLFGDRSVLALIAAVGAGAAVTTVAMRLSDVRRGMSGTAAPAVDDRRERAPRLPLAAAAVAVVLLQAANYGAVVVTTLFVTRSLGLDVMWAGVALGVCAALEVPALVFAGWLGARFAAPLLMVAGALAGVAYNGLVVLAAAPAALLGLQVLNAFFIAIVSGIGLAWFQAVIPGPGLASGLFMNTRKIGAILSGPVVGLAGVSSLGYGAVFLGFAGLCALALVFLLGAARHPAMRTIG